MRNLLRVVLAIAVVVIVVAVVRHVINQGSPSTTTTTTISSSTTTSTQAHNSLTTCHASDFTGAFNQGQGAAGTISASITLTKVTAGSCNVKGWPIVTMQDKLGSVLAITNVDEPTDGGFSFTTAAANRAPQLVHLSQGEFTTFSLAYNDVPTGTLACPTVATFSVQLRAAGSTVTVTPSYGPTPCAGRMWFSPFY